MSLSGHLFDQFLINEALDIIEAAGGSFHLVKCQVGQSTDALSYSELEVSKPVTLVPQNKKEEFILIDRCTNTGTVLTNHNWKSIADTCLCVLAFTKV